jgi:hypothetical protein
LEGALCACILSFSLSLSFALLPKIPARPILFIPLERDNFRFAFLTFIPDSSSTTGRLDEGGVEVECEPALKPTPCPYENELISAEPVADKFIEAGRGP